jgi:hypothetical protein
LLPLHCLLDVIAHEVPNQHRGGPVIRLGGPQKSLFQVGIDAAGEIGLLLQPASAS